MEDKKVLKPAPVAFIWESINETSTTSTSRAKVHGGWLVTVTVIGRGGSQSTTNFVDDPQWEWEIKK